MKSDSDHSAKTALTALCVAASQAGAIGDEIGNGVGPPDETSRPALAVKFSMGTHSTPKALSSMSVDFASDDEEEGGSISDSEFSCKGSRSGTTKPQKKAKQRPARGSHASGKWRKSANSSKRRKKKKGNGGVGNGSDASDDDEGLSYAISKLPKPKRAMTAYNFFFQAERKKLVDMGFEAYEAMMAGQPPPDPKECKKEEVSFQLIGKTIGRWWKQSSETDLKRYQSLAMDDARRYKRERKIYKAEVASMKHEWIQQYGKGKPPPSRQSRSVVTESDPQSSSNSSFAQGTGNDTDLLNDIIQSLTEEQVHLLYSLHNRQQQDQQESQNNTLLAPVIERLRSTLPLPSAITANQSTASAIGVSSDPSGQTVPDLLALCLLQSQRLSELQNQINMLNQQQNRQQSPPPMPLVLPQQDWLINQQQQQQGNIQHLLAPIAPHQVQLQQLPPLNQNQNQLYQQLHSLVPTDIHAQGFVFENANSQTFLPNNTNGTTALPLFESDNDFSIGQGASSAATSNSRVEGGLDKYWLP